MNMNITNKQLNPTLVKMGRKDKSSYNGFLTQCHNVIVKTSFSNSFWGDLDNFWATNFIQDIEKLNLDQEILDLLKAKLSYLPSHISYSLYGTTSKTTTRNAKARDVVQQLYNYMSENELQSGVLSTYDRHWFIKRDYQDIYISESLSLDTSFSPVLKAYTYIALQAKENPYSLHLNKVKVQLFDENNKLKSWKQITTEADSTRSSKDVVPN
ncbi:hypothetical protein C1646_759790 [Rhizophagus diaphanus]|nr:hypothetical protein C1646_759790 [Rhizophagus diaphanus] [Rhizophagus sp. MUCL 43196]